MSNTNRTIIDLIHPEAAAKRPSKDAAEAPWPRPSRLTDFVGERLKGEELSQR